MENLRLFYDEHAKQARQHEDQRERTTNIILVLIGFITFSDLSIWSLPSSIGLAIIGIFGWVFARKHYERNRFHTEIMSETRKALDKSAADSDYKPRSLGEIRKKAKARHYSRFGDTKKDVSKSVDDSETENCDKGEEDGPTWIVRSRLHWYWGFVHVVVVALALGLIATTVAKNTCLKQETTDEVIYVRLVDES